MTSACTLLPPPPLLHRSLLPDAHHVHFRASCACISINLLITYQITDRSSGQTQEQSEKRAGPWCACVLYSSVPHRVRLTTEPLCLIHIVHGRRAPGCFKPSIVGSCPNTGRPSDGYPDLASLACLESYIITLMSLCSRVMNGT